MITEILIAIIIGTLFGCITGICPGIHINLLSILILSLSPLLLQYTSPVILAIIIISMAITHTFLDSLPSIFLGAPDSDMALSVLPGHRMLLQGLGYEAVVLTVMGSLLAVLVVIFISPILVPLVSKFYPIIKNYIPHILILASTFLIIKERKSKTWALIVYLLAGVLGIITLNLPLKQPLFPLLSGLFGTSILTISLIQKTKIPKQIITKTEISNKETAKSLTKGFFASALCGLLPGLGAAQAAIIASSVERKTRIKSFLLLLGSINTMVMIISFIALYTINRTRNGAVVVISKILEFFNIQHLILFLAVSLIVAGIATILALQLAKVFSKIMTKINYQKTCLFIIILIIGLVTILTGPLGLFILIISTSTGMIPTLKGIGKNHLMGCLLLPVILFFIL
jgi:putative membrane protein